MSLHIFWDNSNILGCAQNLKEVNEPDVPWYALRVYFKHLYEIVENGREVVTKIMAGSVPPECEDLWDYTRELGFETDLLRRVKSGQGNIKEQGVDEVLHMKMANAILDFKPPQTMALLSGDSRCSDYDTSYPKQLERALKNGWEVEVYSASMAISDTAYDPLINNYKDRIKIIYLDDYYYKITFVKDGRHVKSL